MVKHTIKLESNKLDILVEDDYTRKDYHEIIEINDKKMLEFVRLFFKFRKNARESYSNFNLDDKAFNFLDVYVSNKIDKYDKKSEYSILYFLSFRPDIKSGKITGNVGIIANKVEDIYSTTSIKMEELLNDHLFSVGLAIHIPISALEAFKK